MVLSLARASLTFDASSSDRLLCSGPCTARSTANGPARDGHKGALPTIALIKECEVSYLHREFRRLIPCSMVKLFVYAGTLDALATRCRCSVPSPRTSELLPVYSSTSRGFLASVRVFIRFYSLCLRLLLHRFITAQSIIRPVGLASDRPSLLGTRTPSCSYSLARSLALASSSSSPSLVISMG